MKIYPAIDLINGICVRLHKGDYDQKTEYHSNPLKMAESFAQQGAEYIHIVDLSGAKDPESHQRDLITRIIQETGLKAQVGGGIRSKEQAVSLINSGVDQIIIGSLAANNPNEVIEITKIIGPDRIVIGLDCFANQGINSPIAIHGWQKNATQTVKDIIETYTSIGIKKFLCTDINKDGTLTTPNFNYMEEVQSSFPEIKLTLSGGVAELSHIVKAKAMNLEAAIIGKALYENRFSLSEALQC